MTRPFSVSSLACFAMLSLAAALGGCVAPTYINIPPENGDWAFSNPNAKDVREIQAVAITRLLADEPIGGPYEIILPEKTTPETYAMVAYALGPDALVPAGVPAVELDEEGKPVSKSSPDAEAPVVLGGGLGEFPAIEVKSIRIRSAEGEVELVRPSAIGRRLISVYLEWEGGFGWSAVRTRAWRVDPDVQPVPVGPTSPSLEEWREGEPINTPR